MGRKMKKISGVRGKFLKSPKKKAPEPEMRAEYDFSKAVRGKYAKRFSEGCNIILLDPDVAGLFPDSKTVNDALRAPVSYTHLRAHETRHDLVCRLLLEKKKK